MNDDHPPVPSQLDCQLKADAYMREHGHEGTASDQEKRQAFIDAYWNFKPKESKP